MLTPNHFNFVFQQPQRAGTPQITILGRMNTLGHPRIGLTSQHSLPAMDFVVIAKKGVQELDNRALTEILEKLWRRHCRQARVS